MLRRAVDVLVAAVAGVVLSPVAALAALAVRLRLGRPVLFRQRRVGHGRGRVRDREVPDHAPGGYPGEPDAERDTRVGRALRATSVDELPQLWNVVRGDMSLIGPRPTLPEQVAHYSPRQRGRHAVRPGLTGWAQVNGRNSITWPERIELDLWYIEHRSLPLDARIVGRTLLRLVRRDGLYGEGGVNQGFPRAESDRGESG